MTQAPIALSCGEPAGIGPEIAARAWEALRDSCPFVWIGDPWHLPEGTPMEVVQHPRDALRVAANALPVLVLDFAAPAIPGQPSAANA
ncbi:MAG: 4-hydroxythreonine-4-phosphate dehydrogenase, partial [Pseudomonadota bacterium]|nr:4-hydroxythreonine-4-phosphate dehydrogenase [Pseudomonadota bacterium]